MADGDQDLRDRVENLAEDIDMLKRELRRTKQIESTLIDSSRRINEGISAFNQTLDFNQQITGVAIARLTTDVETVNANLERLKNAVGRRFDNVDRAIQAIPNDVRNTVAAVVERALTDNKKPEG